MRDSMRGCCNRERQIRRGFTVLILLVSVVSCGPVPSDEVSCNETPLGASDAVGRNTETGIGQPAEAASPAPPMPNSARPLVVPEALAKELASPDVQVRVQALDRWAQHAPTGLGDPLIMALEDADELVQARALELLVQDWQRAQEAN